ACLVAGCPELEEKRAPLSPGIRDEPHGAAEQVDSRADVLPALGTAGRGGELLGRPCSQGRIRRAELFAVAVGLLEVIADDLRRSSLSQPGDEPVREALVQLPALTLRHRLIGGVADQD